MATPFDQIGGLLGMDPEQLKALMSQFAPGEDERKAAKMTGLTQLGLGLLGARKGREWDQAGYAGQNALAARDASLAGSQAAKMQQFQMMEHFAKLNAGQQEAQRKAALNQKIGGLFNAGNPTQGMADRSPTVENAANVPARRANWEIYLQASQEAALGGDMAAAKHWADLAEKHKPKYSQSPQIGMDANGKPYQFVLDDSGNEKRLSAGAKPDFAEVDLGGTKQFVNKYNLPASGQSFAKTMTPDAVASNQLGWANFGLAKNADQRAAASAKGGDKPQMVNGQWVYLPDAQNPTGRAVTPSGMQAPDKPLTESQAKATAYVNMMENANRELANLSGKGFTGSGKIQQAQIENAGGEGIPYVPGSGMIQRSWLASDDAQKYYNAQLQWTEPVLRFQTGANAPKEEVVRNAATYFPRPGDSDEVIAQKEAARAAMEDSMRLAAGAGSAKVPQRAAAAKPTSQQEYDKLPSGSVYTAPDGSKRRKK